MKKNRHRNFIIFFFLIAAFALRFYAATRPDLIYDEKKWIGLVQQCSVTQGEINLIYHGYQHPFLPVYLIKLSSMFFGNSHLGYRFFNILAGVLTIWVVYLMALRWLNFHPALWAVIFFSFNEYHIAISSFAVEKSFYMLFVSLALYFFYKALHENRRKTIILSGACVGFAFLCKEIAGLLPPIFCLYLLFSKYRYWLKRKETYIALLLLVVIISPDIYWNLTNTIPQDGYVNYFDHLNRIGRVGFSVYAFAFYFADFFKTHLTRLNLWYDPSPEYPGLNIIWGLLCLAGVMFSVHENKHCFKRLLLYMFFVIFGLLTFLKWKPSPNFGIGFIKVEWFWCSVTLIPAVLLTADKIVQIKNKHMMRYYFIVILIVAAIGKSCIFLWGWR